MNVQALSTYVCICLQDYKNLNSHTYARNTYNYARFIQIQSDTLYIHRYIYMLLTYFLFMYIHTYLCNSLNCIIRNFIRSNVVNYPHACFQHFIIKHFVTWLKLYKMYVNAFP